MAEAAFATLVTFDVDLDSEEAQRSGLVDHVLPAVRQAEGFVRGTWTLDRTRCQRVALVEFASEEAAAAFAESVRANADAQRAVGIELRDIRIVEVDATA